MQAIGQIRELAIERGPRAGGTHLVCVDGLSGTGKTTLARHLGEAWACQVIGMDELYDGWTGVEYGIDQAAAVTESLAQRKLATYRRYDWHAERFTETVDVPAAAWLVIEGVGAGSLRVSHHCSALVVMDAAKELRHERVLHRDGEAIREPLEAFWVLEEELLAREQTAERADLRIDGS